ncbi:Putative Mn2+ efflux pump MntP [Clostridium collagenovorans DSM 3089]|uniref:Putative Mn2+ efflux pump MntP n=1 Tax=Clostridium collagenovorans DSM 3089 TaxID=1121306 RepID=A0A1M5VX90_9CLOT|nr:manganese efflux pump [Clostridium collagenovorans]SHH79543.1 Putative Mn2+ efflux pump MntP [Clostridium collagenovorans DSM 3089]
MNIYYVILIALAVSLDAFAVALSIGLDKRVNGTMKLGVCSSFGFFQFFIAFIGGVLGIIFNTYFLKVPQIMSGFIVSLVGIIILKEEFENKEKELVLKFFMCIILGISVSIDAGAIMFGIASNLSNYAELLYYTLIIGAITFVMTSIAFFISKVLRKIEVVEKYATYIGAVILILLGIKIMF